MSLSAGSSASHRDWSDRPYLAVAWSSPSLRWRRPALWQPLRDRAREAACYCSFIDPGTVFAQHSEHHSVVVRKEVFRDALVFEAKTRSEFKHSLILLFRSHRQAAAVALSK